MKKIILFLIIFAIAAVFLKAQISIDKGNSVFLKDLSEKVHLFTDRDIYLSGEEARFTVFVAVNNTAINFSEII